MKGVLKLEDGRELTIELDNGVLKYLEESRKTGYERVCNGEKYYTTFQGKVESFHEMEIKKGGLSCLEDYKCANYYSDRTVAENNVKADTLMRKLRRFSAEHREKEFCWNDETQLKYEIYYYHKDQDIKISPIQTCQNFGSIYFDTREAAKAAIEEFKDELLWYFTEYKSSL